MSFTRGFYDWYYPSDGKEILQGLEEGKEALYCYNNLVFNLSFRGNSLDEIVSRLETNTTCKAIVFGGNVMDVAGYKGLALMLVRNRSLKYFSIANNEIGDNGALFFSTALKFNKTLVGLSLVGNGIGDDGAQYLAAALAENTTLTSLDLSKNRVTDTGVEPLRMALERNSSLMAVFLRQNPVTVNGSAMVKLEGILARNRKEQKAEFRHVLENANVTGEWSRAKVMLLGKEKIGKTALVNSLLAQPFNTRWDSTVGINISESRVNGLSWNAVEKQETRFLPHFAAKITAKLIREKQTQVVSDEQQSSLGEGQQLVTIGDEEGDYEGGEGSDASEDDGETDSAFSGEGKEEEYKEEWILRARNEKDDLRVALFDFGGQKVFYSLHQLFFTKFAFYVLVFNASEVHDAPTFTSYIRFWLRTIDLHAPKSPIIIVGTFLDDMDESSMEIVVKSLKKVNEEGFQLVTNKKHKLPYFLVDNKSSNGVLLLRRALEALVKTTEFVRFPVPIKWIKCLDAMLNQPNVQWLSMKQVKVVSYKCGVTSTEEVDSMLLLFHQLGCLLYFNRSAALREFITLHPQWLVDQVAKVIFDPDVHPNAVNEHFVKTGILSKASLEKVWDADKVEFLVELMQNALLLSQWTFNSRSNLYFIPSMAVQTKPFGKIKGPCFRVSLDNALPMGLFYFLECLCVSHSSTLRVPEPVISNSGFSVFLKKRTKLAMKIQGDDSIHVCSSDKKSARLVLSMVASMLRKLKDEVLGANLSWRIEFKKKDEFLSFAEAKRDMLPPWFEPSGNTLRPTDGEILRFIEQS